MADSFRSLAHEFIEGRSPAGRHFEALIVSVIVLNVGLFIWSTVPAEVSPEAGHVLWVVEAFTSVLFTLEYAVRLWTVVETVSVGGDRPYAGCAGRMRWACTAPLSWVDVASFAPFYIKVALGVSVPATQAVRFVRLFRVLWVEDRLMGGFVVLSTVWERFRHIILSTFFLGTAVWLSAATCYYLAERDNPRMGAWATATPPQQTNESLARSIPRVPHKSTPQRGKEAAHA